MKEQLLLQDEIVWPHPKEKILLTREGKELNVSGDVWMLPYPLRPDSSLNFNKVFNLNMRSSLKAYLEDRIKRVSTHAGYSDFQDVWREILRFWDINDKNNNVELYLIKLMEEAINRARSSNSLWRMYRTIQWYLWCAENYPENGFSEVYAQELAALDVPGNPKGEAVKMEDPVQGPLHRSLELPLLISALTSDEGQDFEHLQQKVVVALSIAFGRNPANLTYLRESDLVVFQTESEEQCFLLKMPRIKKRLMNPRDDFLEEYLAPKFGVLVKELIEFNQSIPLQFAGKAFVRPEERPLLIKRTGNTAAINSQDIENIFNMTSEDIVRLIQNFVKRHNIVSPLTGELMHVTSRRLRYTLATGLVAEGISRAELARILDHSDTQHVHVYFEVANQIVEHLDKAMAKGFSKYLNFFKGNIIDENDKGVVNAEREDKHLIYIDEHNPKEQVNIGVCGESSVCHLDPPYSCYLCPKFQPYRHADHEHVLDCLLANREERLEKYENARLGIQLDEVIAAVAQVATLCSGGDVNA